MVSCVLARTLGCVAWLTPVADAGLRGAAGRYALALAGRGCHLLKRSKAEYAELPQHELLGAVYLSFPWLFLYEGSYPLRVRDFKTTSFNPPTCIKEKS